MYICICSGPSSGWSLTQYCGGDLYTNYKDFLSVGGMIITTGSCLDPNGAGMNRMLSNDMPGLNMMVSKMLGLVFRQNWKRQIFPRNQDPSQAFCRCTTKPCYNFSVTVLICYGCWQVVQKYGASRDATDHGIGIFMWVTVRLWQSNDPWTSDA